MPHRKLKLNQLNLSQMYFKAEAFTAGASEKIRFYIHKGALAQI